MIEIVAQLRHPLAGCEWDRAQTFATIVPYTIEEAYEVADAIAREAHDELSDELGDLLLQVVFHARIAEEVGLFAFADVVVAICEKMERRHPHIFGTAGSSPGWEAIKATERSRRSSGALDGVALALPALVRAEKLQRRAAASGFDWPDATGARAKINEELYEVETSESETRAEEIGDLLFSVVNWARHLGIDSEAALRSANSKFEERFAGMEQRAGDAFTELDLSAKESLWQEVKRRHPPACS